MAKARGRKASVCRIMMAVALAALILAATLAPGLAAAKSPPGPLGSPNYMTVDNGVIRLQWFGEVDAYAWYYPPGTNNLSVELPLVGYGADPTNVPVGMGTVVAFYPAAGVPGVWYDAVVLLDLDGDQSDEVAVTRSVMVPSGTKYFLVRYTLQNISGKALPDLRLLEYVDYDVGPTYTGDAAGYDSKDFLWTHDVSDGITNWVGFRGSAHSGAHSVDETGAVWQQVSVVGILNNANYYYGDPAVGMKWDFGTLADGDSAQLMVKFAFADSFDELGNLLAPSARVPAVTAWGTVGMVALFGVALAFAMWRARRRSQRA
jgi:hypothetical protein